MLEAEGLAKAVCRKLELRCPAEPDLTDWIAMVDRQKAVDRRVRIAIVGKYVALHDSYLSVVESLKHGGIFNDTVVDIEWIHSEDLETRDPDLLLSGVDGILVPGGFGSRGIEGKILAVQYARERMIPYFGICLGMQMAVIEFSRHVAGLADAHSSEFAPDSCNCVIDLMDSQRGIENKGGTMRLGAYPCVMKAGTKSAEAYGTLEISERHRHRWEYNNKYREQFEVLGLKIVGTSPDDRLVEMVELKGHPWFVGVQFHPEFKSRPNRPHPLFREFVRASLERAALTSGQTAGPEDR
jgi:CTP synthase